MTRNNTPLLSILCAPALIVLTLTACAQDRTVHIPSGVQAGLVYVEDTDRRGGITAGSFGNIVIIHPGATERTMLTNDHSYYRHPYMCTTKIAFEVKIGHGLSALSQIHAIDISSREREVVYSPNASGPFLSHPVCIDNSIGAIFDYNPTLDDYGEGSYLEFNSEAKNHLLKLQLPVSGGSVSKIRTSTSGRIIALQYSRFRSISHRDILFIEHSGDEPIVSSVLDLIGNSISSNRCLLGSWIDDDEVLVLCSTEDRSETILFSVDPESRQTERLGHFEFVITEFEPVDRQWAFALIGDDPDIVLMDMMDGSFEYITTDGRAKSDLFAF